MARILDGTALVLMSLSLAAFAPGATAEPDEPPKIASVLTISDHDADVWSATYNTDGSRILTASADRTARVWDATTGKELLKLAGHEEAVRHAAYNPESTLIVTASRDATARLWDAQSG